MRSFYDSIRQGGTTALQIVGEERRQHEKGLEQLRYARKMKTYIVKHTEHRKRNDTGVVFGNMRLLGYVVRHLTTEMNT